MSRRYVSKQSLVSNESQASRDKLYRNEVDRANRAFGCALASHGNEVEGDAISRDSWVSALSGEFLAIEVRNG